MSVNGIPYSVLYNLPAGTPPPGIVPNFINPPSRDTELIVLNTVFLSLMWIVVLLRLYAKGRILRTIGWDDYTCAIAALASTAHSAAELNVIKLGFGRHIWDIRVTTLLSTSIVRQMSATSIIYPFVIYFVKLSILLLYLRIFGIYRSIRVTCHLAIVFFTLFYLAYFGVQAAILAKCVSEASQALALCKNVYPVTVFQAAFNVASDIFIFTLPIYRILKLHVARRQRIGLLIIFLAGLVACGVSIARLAVTTITLKRADKFWYASLSGTLTIVEINLAIIAACMSTLPGVLSQAKKYGSSIFRSLRSFLGTSHGEHTSHTSHKWSSQQTPDEFKAGTELGSRKKLENTSYIQLEDHVKDHSSSENLQRTSSSPAWDEA